MNIKYQLDELEERIIDTVSSYMAKVPRTFGVLLSGGYDSGLLAALTKPDFAYRMKFPYGVKFDESRYAEAIAKHLGIELHEIEVTPENFRGSFEAAVKVMGEPTTHFSMVPLYILFKYLSENGVKDMLSGEGPDEYLGGYARQIIFDEIKKMYEIPELRGYHGKINEVLGMDELPVELNNQLIWEYGEMMGYMPEAVVDYQYTKYPLQGAIGKMDMELGVIEKMEQKFANHFGVTLHYPYINHDFAEYCYNLPDDLKIRNGVTKWAFKKIADKYLPPIMKGRIKMGGPVAPANALMGWTDMGDFGKDRYLEEQRKILGQ